MDNILGVLYEKQDKLKEAYKYFKQAHSTEDSTRVQEKLDAQATKPQDKDGAEIYYDGRGEKFAPRALTKKEERALARAQKAEKNTLYRK